MTDKNAKILLCGGGTLGSVNPLLAICEEASKQGKDWEWFWAGTKNGPERALVESLGIKYAALPTAKWRRYWSVANFFAPFVFLVAFIKSLVLMFRLRPQVVITAGSFIGAPVVWSAFLLSFLRPVRRSLGEGGKQESRIIVHQQDIRPGLANKLCAPCAHKITVSFEKSLADYPPGKAEWLGNPVREWIGQGSREEANRLWGLDKNYPTLLIMGGSSGAQSLNEWVWRNLPQLTELANVIHLTGRGKKNPLLGKEGRTPPYPPHESTPNPLGADLGTPGKGGSTTTRYIQLEFLDKDLAHALATADLVVSRAGIATLSELAYLGKAAILVPLADTHQEENAAYFAEHHAAVVFKQNKLDERVVNKIKSLLAASGERAVLSQNIKKLIKPGGRKRLAGIIESFIN